MPALPPHVIAVIEADLRDAAPPAVSVDSLPTIAEWWLPPGVYPEEISAHWRVMRL